MTTITPQELSKHVWVANAIYRTNTQRAFEKVPIMRVLAGMYKNNPDLDPAEALATMNEWQAAYTERMHSLGSKSSGTVHSTEQDLVNSAFTIIGTHAKFGQAATIGKEAFSWANRASDHIRASDLQVLAQSRQFQEFVSIQSYNEQAWRDVIEIASTNPNAAQVLDTFMGTFLNATTRDSAEVILASNPDFATTKAVAEIREQIGPDGELTRDLNDLMDLARTQQRDLSQWIVEERQLLAGVAAQQDSFSAYIADEERRAAAQAQIENARQFRQLEIDAAKSGVYLFSSLIGAGDPKSGHAVGVIGNATLQVAEAIGRYAEAAARLGDAASGLGAAVLTGNVAGAVMSVMSLFGDGGPGPMDFIRDAIEDLRQEVQGFRLEMHSRFDRIDRMLNLVLEFVDTRFNRIDLVLGTLADDITQVKEELVALKGDLSQLSRNVAAFLAAGFRADLSREINYSLGHAETYGTPLPVADFNRAEALFFTWATDTALDELRAGPEHLEDGIADYFSDSRAFEILTSTNVEAQLNYLCDLAHARFGVALGGGGRIANPREWTLAAQAYARLMLENPEAFGKIHPYRLEGVLAIGRALQRTCTDMSSGDAGPELFKQLTQNYRKGLSKMYEAARLRRSTLQKNHLKLQGGQWKLGQRMMSIRVGGPLVGEVPGLLDPILPTSLPVPEGMGELIPESMRVAELMGAGRLAFNYEVYWMPVERVEKNHGREYGEDTLCHWWKAAHYTGTLLVFINTYWITHEGTASQFSRRMLSVKEREEYKMEITFVNASPLMLCAPEGIEVGVKTERDAVVVLSENWQMGRQLDRLFPQESEELLGEAAQNGVRADAWLSVWDANIEQYNL
jgi:hypothetical protein